MIPRPVLQLMEESDRGLQRGDVMMAERATQRALHVLVFQPRIQQKAKQVQAGIERWRRSGRDPRRVAVAMGELQKLMQGGNLPQAEALLDRMLTELQKH